MKKTVLKALASIVVLTAFALTLTGCFKGGDSVSGKEGAMLLLANERLGGEMIDKNDSIFKDAESALVGMAEQGRSFLTSYENTEEKEPAYENGRARTRSFRSGNSGGTLVTDIAAPGRSYTQFNETVLQSVFLAERGADNIRLMKEKVRVLDTWVTFSNSKMLLHVEENSELLLVQDEYYKFICYRTRLEDGTERYDLIQFYRDSDYAIRASYIKNQLYDCNMISNVESGEYDYIGFVAKNVEDSWVCLEYRYFPENDIPYDYSYVIMTEDLCFRAYKQMHLEGQVGSIILSSEDRNVDIMTMYEGEGYSTYQIFVGAYEGYQGVLVGGADEYDNNLVLGDGSVLKSEAEVPEGEVENRFLVKYDTAWGVEFEMGFMIYGSDPAGRNAAFADYLKEIGINYKGDTTEALLAKMNRARETINEIDKYYEWNGYPIGTPEGSMAAHEAEYDIINGYLDVYNSYNDHPTVRQSEIRNLGLASFADLERALVDFEVSGNTAVITSAGASVTDLTLFTSGEKYHLAFALMNDSGLIHIGEYTRNEVTLTGDSLTLTAKDVSLDFSSIAAGEYKLVVYAATSDGIRSTNPTVVGDITISH